MINEGGFIRQLRLLLSARIPGVDARRKLEIVQRLCREYITQGEGGQPPDCFWVPFVPGRRPIDDATYPGLGSSDHVAFLLGEEGSGKNWCFLLCRIAHIEDLADEDLESCEIRVSLSFTGPWGDTVAEPLPNWQRRRVAPRTFALGTTGEPVVQDATLREGATRALVIAIAPDEIFLPCRGWSMVDLDPLVREHATDTNDPFTFGSLFIQQVHAELLLTRDGMPISASSQVIDVCDARRLGSLYRRVIDRVIVPDTTRQAERLKIPGLSHTHHPWFPVLLIGSDKADLYKRALVEDIVQKKRHLTDPRWLLRVGLYLEFLTCIGIFEAVRDDLGDLLTPAERAAYETSPWFREIRDSVNVEGWKRVWGLRSIVKPQVGTPRAGDVSALNLVAKKGATLAFLKTHHEDLKHAIRLAGPNEHNAQETWHRVFRDAERAVLRKTTTAFPEITALGPKASEFILWHQKGKIGGLRLSSFTSWFGDQDGLYASACKQYRASMNHVAEWAKQQGLLDYTGDECIPETVSLLAAFMNGRRVRLGQLQRRDGYAETIDVAADAPAEFEVSKERILSLLRGVSLFKILRDDELEGFASTVRPITLGPNERIMIQGRPGSSLFILEEGELEVLVRQRDGHDLSVATLQDGAVFGECSLLTGEPRNATVRSVDSATVYEIGRTQFAHILRARPTLVDELAAIMAPRIRANLAAEKGYKSQKEIRTLAKAIRALFLP